MLLAIKFPFSKCNSKKEHFKRSIRHWLYKKIKSEIWNLIDGITLNCGNLKACFIRIFAGQPHFLVGFFKFRRFKFSFDSLIQNKKHNQNKKHILNYSVFINKHWNTQLLNKMYLLNIKFVIVTQGINLGK